MRRTEGGGGKEVTVLYLGSQEKCFETEASTLTNSAKKLSKTKKKVSTESSNIEITGDLDQSLSQVRETDRMEDWEVQFSSVAQSCLTLCNSMDCSTPGFPVHHQLLELTQTHVH